MHRLAEALSAPSCKMRGRVRPDRVRLERRIAYRNSFQPRMTARIRDCADGTCFDITIGMHPAVWIFLAFWAPTLGPLALAIDGQAIIELLRDGATDVGVLALALTGMLVFAVLLVFAGRMLARSEKSDLLAFLQTVTLARSV